MTVLQSQLGNGAGPVFEAADVVAIADALASHVTPTGPSPELKALLEAADGVSERLEALQSVSATSIQSLADLFLDYIDHLEAIGVVTSTPLGMWSLQQRLTFVTMASRLRRYARNEPPAFFAFLKAMGQRAEQVQLDPTLMATMW